MTKSSVHLICMPFQNRTLSSLSIALLATILKDAGIVTAESYPHFEFSRLLGAENYSLITNGGTRACLSGELLFAEAYYGSVEDERSLEQLQIYFGDRSKRKEMLTDFREYCLAEIEKADASIVGFSTSNNQLMSSLWLARAIKEQQPEVTVVFGGSACSLPMGRRIKENYTVVDVVIAGYGERVLLDIALGKPIPHDGIIVDPKPVPLDSLPIPDYSTFISTAISYGADQESLMLAVEGSRGCWWGQKHPCTFCGINQSEMKYNVKSSSHMENEVRRLWELHHFNLFATDAILAREHIREVLPLLARLPERPQIFFEIKANLKSYEVEVLGKAGVLWIQPGIESLSTGLLKLLKKGVTAMQNIALLKHCRTYGLRVSWNLLCGIPGEEISLYDAQIELIDLIPHLTPPVGVHPVRVDRYSSYFKDFRGYGWSEIYPFEEYYAMHPHVPKDAVYDLAYHFHSVGNNVEVVKYIDRLNKALERWKERHTAGNGLFWDNGRLIRVEGKNAFVFASNSLLESIIENTHDIISIQDLCEHTGVNTDIISEFIGEGILLKERDRVLNLAVSVSV